MKLGDLIEKLEEIRGEMGSDIDVGVVVDIEREDGIDGLYYSIDDTFDVLDSVNENNVQIKFLGFDSFPVLEIGSED